MSVTLASLERRVQSLEVLSRQHEHAAAQRAYKEDAALMFERAVREEPDPWQRDLLGKQPQRAVLLCSRQSGKSTTTAILALHKALYSPGSLVLLLAPALRQSRELFKKVASFYMALGQPVPATSVTSSWLELQNESRIVALPGSTESTIRGFSGVDLLIIDEAARVADELYFAVRPMLAVSGGELIALSTPFGKRGWFYETWANGAGWERVKVTAYDCPRITEEFLEEERRTLGEWWFAQEYLCQFKEATDQVFSYDLVMGAMSSEIEPLFKD